MTKRSFSFLLPLFACALLSSCLFSGTSSSKEPYVDTDSIAVKYDSWYEVYHVTGTIYNPTSTSITADLVFNLINSSGETYGSVRADDVIVKNKSNSDFKSDDIPLFPYKVSIESFKWN